MKKKVPTLNKKPALAKKLAKQAAKKRAAMEKADAAERGVMTVGIDAVLDCSPQTFIKGLYALLDRRYARADHIHSTLGEHA